MLNFISNQRDQLSFLNTNFDHICLLRYENVIKSYMPNENSYGCPITNF